MSAELASLIAERDGLRRRIAAGGSGVRRLRFRLQACITQIIRVGLNL